MITSITGVTRNAGVDLPTPARATTTPPAAEQPQTALSGPARDAEAGRTPQAASTQQQGQRRDEEHQPAADDQATAATSRYLADLLTARVLGTNLDAARPTHITPERLSSLISYLESSLRPAAGSPRDPASAPTGDATASEGVDVTG